MDEADELVGTIPIQYTESLSPSLHLYQYPLLTRPLQVPPSAALSGKRIKARYKPKAARVEVQVPVDTRPEVWNTELGKELGNARTEEDKSLEGDSEKGKWKETEERRLGEVRMLGDKVPHSGIYMLGVVRSGKLHLHPISQTHQLRPSMTYLDVISKRAAQRNRRRDSDSESDGPPPDPDEPPRPPSPKKEKKSAAGEAKEVQVRARQTEEKGLLGGLSTVRREMLMQMREEAEEKWESLDWHDGDSEEASTTLDSLLSTRNEGLVCTTTATTMLSDIKGL